MALLLWYSDSKTLVTKVFAAVENTSFESGRECRLDTSFSGGEVYQWIMDQFSPLYSPPCLIEPTSNCVWDEGSTYIAISVVCSRGLNCNVIELSAWETLHMNSGC